VSIVMAAAEAEQRTRFGLVLRRIRVEGFKSLRNVELRLNGRNPVVLVGANGSGKTNVVELFLFLRRALHDELQRRPYAPHAEWGSPLNLTWEASGKPIRVELEYSITAQRGRERLSERLLYTVVFAADAAAVRPVQERIELPKLGYTLERVGERLEARLRAEEGEEKLHDLLRACCEEASVECRDGWCSVAQRLESSDDDVPPVLASTMAAIPLTSRNEKLPAVDFIALANGSEVVAPFPANPAGLRLGTLLRLLRSWFGGIVVLRQVDYSVAKWPHQRYSDAALRPRGENLAEVLYRVMRSRRGRERIEAAMAVLFPWLEVRVEFNEYGQIGLAFYEKRGERRIQLHPSMVPDGVVKLLAVLAAAALEPSLLAVDEVENSLHASLIDYIVKELEGLEDPVILATHSPVVVDLAGPERTLLLRRAPDGSTVVEQLAPRELWEKMREEGIALSDYYLYATP